MLASKKTYISKPVGASKTCCAIRMQSGDHTLGSPGIAITELPYKLVVHQNYSVTAGTILKTSSLHKEVEAESKL